MDYSIHYTLTLAQAPAVGNNPSDTGASAPTNQNPAQAQPAPGQSATAPAQGGGGDGGLWSMAPILVLGLLFVAFMLYSGQAKAKKAKKQREELDSGIRKNVKVQSIGGIIGTVTDVKDDEVWVRVDETNNTRMRFAKTAIAKVMEKNDSKKED